MAQSEDAATSPRILIVTAVFYRDIADMLIAGAKAALEQAGARVEAIEAPGALEAPTMIAYAADSGRFDGFVALGCVIRGETTHYELVSNESARALTLLGLERRLAIGNGILTVENGAQAYERADPSRKNKGAGAAEACLALIAARRRFTPPARGGAASDPILLA